jgi:cytochrome c5
VPSFRKLVPPLLHVGLVLAMPVAVAADEGEKVYKDVCTQCHDAKTRPLDGMHLTREKWKEAIEKMEGMGTDVPSGKKLDELLDFLVRTRGPESGAPAGGK